MSTEHRDKTCGSMPKRHVLRMVGGIPTVCVVARLSLALFLLSSMSVQAAEQRAPILTRASTYQQNLDPRGYWVSEKLDGVRGYWDGRVLMSRTGTPINAPDWFVAGLPDTALDGELWLGRRRFDELAGLLRRKEVVDEDWRAVRFMIFDLPQSPLDFDQRLAHLRTIIAEVGVPWLQLIEQFRVDSVDALYAELERVVALGGEGLMLHKGSARYHGMRNDDLLKLKPVYDAEATVLAWLPGRGRLEGMMGSLLVETVDGIRFRLGTGFSDAERSNPPPVGSVVTYQYSGFTPAGIPRFARFLRVREAF